MVLIPYPSVFSFFKHILFPGPGWWRDDQEIAHYGCTQQNPAADAPEIAATPVLSETGNDAFMTVSVKLENTTTNAYLTLTDGGTNVQLSDVIFFTFMLHRSKLVPLL